MRISSEIFQTHGSRYDFFDVSNCVRYLAYFTINGTYTYRYITTKYDN